MHGHIHVDWTMHGVECLCVLDYASTDVHGVEWLCGCSPPAAGSTLHRRLVAMGRAAAAYGKFQAAREAYAAAGQWVELMPLCALQGDFDSLRDYAARVSGTQVLEYYTSSFSI